MSIKNSNEKHPLFLVEFNKIYFFFDRISINSQISNLMKICSVEAELFHAGGRTDKQSFSQVLRTPLKFVDISLLGIFYAIKSTSLILN